MFSGRVSVLSLSFVLAALSMASAHDAQALAGLIGSGLDTLCSRSTCPGLDLVMGNACRDTGGGTCVSHLRMNYVWVLKLNSERYSLGGPTYFADYGKMNLDSIKQAPPDSAMHRSGDVYDMVIIDAISPDSLPQHIGNVYVFKTFTDPRPGGVPIIAKIKILNFIVRDTARHDISMVFLWVANISGFRDLPSALDTFRLDSGVVRASRNVPRHALGRPAQGQFGLSMNSLQGTVLLGRGALLVDVRGRALRECRARLLR